MAHALAIDIGGTKMAAGLVDDEGHVAHSLQLPTDPHLDGDALFGALAGMVAELADEDVDVCGVGCGGPMRDEGDAVSPVNIPAWRRFPLRSRLRDLLDVPVFVDNDAKALALAEGWLGAAKGRRNFVGMVVSTGVGGGIVLDGRLLDGADGNAGHIGHVIVEPGGRRCGCGARGCLEAEASGTAIAAVTGRPPAECATEVRVRTGRLVGRAVGSVANLLDLDLAVVAGSVALGFGPVFFAAAQAELDDVARLEYSVGCRIVPAGLGGAAPLIGAAAIGWSASGRAILDQGSAEAVS